MDESVELPVAFELPESDERPDKMSRYKFSRFPQKGDHVAGEKFEYEVAHILHADGFSAETEPYVIVILKVVAGPF